MLQNIRPSQRTWIGALAVALVAVPAAPVPAQPPAAGDTSTLNLDEFAANLHAAHKGKCVGYGFAVYKDGKLVRDGGSGMARVASDAPARSFDSSTRVDIASCSKLLTAITVLHELERRNMKVTEPIHKHLPKSWPVHESIRSITFEELLAHKSGLKKVGEASKEAGKASDFMKAVLKAGVSDPKKAYNYENVNYTLCRILVPYLRDRAAFEKLEDEPVKFDKAVADCFADLVRKDVFKPAGLSDAISLFTWDATPQKPETLFYDFADPKNGARNKDNTIDSGAGGWWMNARELAAVCSALERFKLVSNHAVLVMRLKQLGLYQVKGKYGTYYWHNGSGSGNVTAKSNFMTFPDGVQVAVVTNSGNNGFADSQKDLIVKAYEDACLQADLVVKAFKPGAAKYDGDFLTVPFTMTVANVGKGDTDAVSFAAVRHGDAIVWSGTTPELKAGGTKEFTGVAKLKDPKRELAGKSVYLVGVADARIAAGDTSTPDYAKVRESDEKNNESEKTEVKVPVTTPKGPDGAAPPKRKGN
jgi:CubicO group peptidase (beta-lactamase class C family)